MKNLFLLSKCYERKSMEGTGKLLENLLKTRKVEAAEKILTKEERNKNR